LYNNFLYIFIYITLSFVACGHYIDIFTNIYCQNNKFIPEITFINFTYKWNNKNAFGKLQMIMANLIFLPSMIISFLICAIVVYLVRFFYWFIELGNKK